MKGIILLSVLCACLLTPAFTAEYLVYQTYSDAACTVLTGRIIQTVPSDCADLGGCNALSNGQYHSSYCLTDASPNPYSSLTVPPGWLSVLQWVTSDCNTQMPYKGFAVANGGCITAQDESGNQFTSTGTGCDGTDTFTYKLFSTPNCTNDPVSTYTFNTNGAVCDRSNEDASIQFNGTCGVAPPVTPPMAEPVAAPVAEPVMSEPVMSEPVAAPKIAPVSAGPTASNTPTKKTSHAAVVGSSLMIVGALLALTL